MVLWNAAAQPNTLFVAQQQLASFCHNNIQRAVLALPGRDVQYTANTIQPYQLAAHRPSYINAILIQSRGVVSLVPCTECTRRGSSPFLDCTKLAGHFGGSCGACKWRDHSSRCRSPSPSPSPESSDKDSSSGSSSDDEFVDAPEYADGGGKSGEKSGRDSKTGGGIVRNPRIQVLI